MKRGEERHAERGKTVTSSAMHSRHWHDERNCRVSKCVIFLYEKKRVVKRGLGVEYSEEREPQFVLGKCLLPVELGAR